MKRITDIFILTAFFVFLSFSRAFADMAYDTGEGPDHGESLLPWIFLIFLIGFIELMRLIARGLMLEKRGVSGWKIIIPVYGRYLEYKTYWKLKYFWINFGIIIYLIFAVAAIYSGDNDTIVGILALLFLAACVVFAVIIVRLRINVMKIFGFPGILGLLEFLGLGFLLDFLCGFSNRGRVVQERTVSSDILQEQFDSWE